MADGTGRPPLDELLSRFEGRLLRYACQLTGEPDLARDVVQETFLRLLRSPSVPGDDGLAPWLFAVCRNCALDGRRRRRADRARRARKAAMQTTELPTTPTPAEASERSELLSIIARLPADQRELIRLKFQDGMTYRQMASITSRSVGSIGSLLHEALGTIRETLAGETRGAR